MELEEEEGEQQQQQRQVIRWERFLPRRPLRVLLVENDDSTRHIVAALLRKCSYNVAAVADGVKAWEFLQEKHYKFDLVLSEVDMPSLSGIDFLDKLTSCDLSRNIPVIMMSSQDSVNVVFKCMLKGAANFLVKPVRRNELCNLWQHVWRKHRASRCINPIERINDNQAKSQDASGNNVAVNRDNSYAESAPKNKDNGDEVRDTQSSCSKPENEVKEVQKCAELCPTEMKDSSTLLGEKLKKSHDSKVMIENSIKQHNYEKRVEENKVGASTQQDVYIHERTFSENRQGVGESDRSSCMKENSGFNEEIGGNFHSSRSLCSVPSTQSTQTIDFIGAAANGRAWITLGKDAHSTDKNIAIDRLLSQDAPVRRPVNGYSNQGFQERHILKHSSASAFSRYGKDIHSADRKSETAPATLCISPKESTTRVQPLVATQKEVASFPACSLALSAGHETYMRRSHQVTSASSNDGGNINIKTHRTVEASSTSHSASQNDDHSVNHTCNEVTHNGLVTFHPGQVEFMPFPFSVGRISIQNLHAGCGAIPQPVLYSEPSPSALTTVRAIKEVTPSDNLGHRGNHPSYDLSSQQTCIQYHLEREKKDHTVDREQRQPETYRCTEVREQMDHHNHCNGHLICGGEGNGVGDITEYHGSLLISTHQGNEGAYQNVNGNCLDSGRSQREAALMKFRLKRKERCFEKKVRYHSRKMLAEQRPRIKGQFVRLPTVEPTNTTTRE